MFEFFSPLDRYAFHRPMLERIGYYEMEKNGKLYLLVNALGISQDDVNVDVQPSEVHNRQVIKISGETYNQLFDKKFSIRLTFNVYKPMKKINKLVENGFLTLEIEFDEPVKPSVEIGTIDRKALTG